MKPDRRRLIDDLLDEHAAERREAILFEGARVLRRRRWRRGFARGCVMVLALAGIGILIEQSAHQKIPRAATASGPAGVHYLTDQELLDLFTNTPVGLATVGDKKRLIFPNPADEKKFVIKL